VCPMKYTSTRQTDIGIVFVRTTRKFSKTGFNRSQALVRRYLVLYPRGNVAYFSISAIFKFDFVKNRSDKSIFRGCNNTCDFVN